MTPGLAVDQHSGSGGINIDALRKDAPICRRYMAALNMPHDPGAVGSSDITNVFASRLNRFVREQSNPPLPAT